MNKLLIFLTLIVLLCASIDQPAKATGSYMADTQRKIKRSWHPPVGKEDKIVVVTFGVWSDGRIYDLHLERTSGDKLADEAALSAVEHASPLRPIPGEGPSHVGIQFTFDFNTYGAGGHGTFRQ